MIDKDIAKKMAREIIEHKTQNGRPIKILEPSPDSDKNTKRDTLSEIIKTQEQADYLRRQLKWLRLEEEEKEKQKEK